MKTKEYIRPMPATWWLHNRYLTLFVLRELSSVFVAGYAVFLMVLLYKAGQAEESFAAFFEAVLLRPWVIVLHLLALAFVLYHSYTSFHLVPQVIVVRRGEEKVSPALIEGAHYALWLIVSVVVFVGALWLPVN
jgi:fumarate reductase subunit C